MRTHVIKASEISRRWHLIDAEGVVLGRLASEAACLLRGKNKPGYSTHLDVGDHVVIVNADKVVLTGRKLDQKKRITHSGYPGGLRVTPYREWLAKKPTEVVRKAIRGMLPKTKLGRKMLAKAKIYAGSEHPHVGQQPEPYQVRSSRGRA